ncbi:sensor histidine kinase [Aquibium microcysteis]|uniref:sensor histidine kinase n=1 Tax=Aquibium microcysteis TaxID=675281 RepID=UPI001EF33C98|nr:sensor histidine kinase [Aquibium microcysteis]
MTRPGEDQEGMTPSGADTASSPSRFDRGLLRALHNTSVSVLYLDRSLHCLWAENQPAGWIGSVLCGNQDGAGLLSADDEDRLRAARQAALAGGDRSHLEVRFPDAGGVRWFEIWIDADLDGSEVLGVITTAVEITERRRREDALRMLLREVSHRSKNLLAIIQSIANQTGRYSGTIADFLQRFRGRLQSLAASQDLVTSSNWRGADLHELVAGQVIRFCPDPVRNLRLEGGNPYLNPNAALHVGLALHELAVNAVSHGALSRPDGLVTIAARPLLDGESDDSGGGAAMELTWRETLASGPAPAAPNGRFGSLALERVVPASLNGTASLTIGDGELLYRLVIPPENYEIG